MSLTCTTCSAPLRTGAPGHGRYDGVPACSAEHGQQAVDAHRRVVKALGATNAQHHINATRLVMLIGGKRDADDAELGAGGTPKSTADANPELDKAVRALPTDLLSDVVAAIDPDGEETWSRIRLGNTLLSVAAQSPTTYRVWKTTVPDVAKWRRAVGIVGRMRWWDALDAMLEAGVLPDTAERNRNFAFYARQDALAKHDISQSAAMTDNGRYVAAKDDDGQFIFAQVRYGQRQLISVSSDQGYQIAWWLPFMTRGIQVSFRGNGTSKIFTPGNLSSVSGLNRLEIYNCDLRYEQDDFVGLALEKLTLHGCGLRAVPAGIAESKTIKELELGNNALTAQPNLGASSALERLDLSYNQIAVVEDGDFPPLVADKINYLNVGGNPLAKVDVMNMDKLVTLVATIDNDYEGVYTKITVPYGIADVRTTPGKVKLCFVYYAGDDKKTGTIHGLGYNADADA